ncbi:MAG: hypothetical protein IMY73_02685 [Bacteroidetes bacterium]|nr:hypothetical protein [Bacteroidota bacterium]
MKKIYVILILVFAFFKVEAQEQNVLSKQELRELNRSYTPYHDIRVSYSLDSFFYGFGNEDLSNDFERKYSHDVLIGPIGFAYTYSCFRWLEFGISCNYAVSYYSGNSNVISRCNFFSISPTARFVWLNRRNIRLYSSVSSGFSMVIDEKKGDGVDVNDTDILNIFQTTFFGISVGRKVFAHAELLTLGSSGFLNFGVGVRFNQKSN